MGKKKTKQQAKKSAKKEVKKLLGRAGAKHPMLANPQNIDEQVASKNPLLASQLDPFNCGRGSKIPNFGIMATATLSVMDRRTLTVNANGIVFCFFQGIMPGLQNGGGAGIDFSSGWFNGSAATATNLFQSSGLAAGVTPFFFGNTATCNTIDSTYQDLRVVSAAITIEYTGTTLNDQGVLIGASYPRETGGYSWPPTTNLSATDFRNSAYAKEVAVNKHQGLTVKYAPSDATSYDYRRTGNRGYPLGPLTFANGGSVSNMFSDGYGSLAVVGVGLTAGTTVNIISVINYESHPEPASTTIVSTTPSYNDPLAMAHAENVVKNMSLVSEGVQSIPKTMNEQTISTTSDKSNKPTFLDDVLKVAHGVKQGVEVASKIASVLI